MAGLAALPLAIAALVAPGAAHAAHVTCDQVVTASITLDNDLIDCPDDALIVGADNITIDLNGHTLDGDRFQPPPQEPEPAPGDPLPPEPVDPPPGEPVPPEPLEPPEPARVGIFNPGYDNVTVVDSGATKGEIREFDYGVALEYGVTGNLISGVRLAANIQAGVQLSAAHSNNRIEGNTLTGQTGHGIALTFDEVTGDGSSGNVVTGNTISATFKDGVLVQRSNGNRVEGNTIHAAAGRGMRLEGSSGTAIADNAFTDNAGGAIVMSGSNNNRIERNAIGRAAGSLAHLSNGIAVSGSGNRVLTNTVSDSGGSAIDLEGATGTMVRGNELDRNSVGVQLEKSDSNTIRNNSARQGTGIGFEIKESPSNTILLNTARGSNSSGISVTGQAGPGQGNLIERNTVNANKDGIQAGSDGHTLKGNTTNNNASWGIKATNGTIDGGGNVARGNGEADQCLNVVCSAEPPPANLCAVLTAPSVADAWIDEGDVNKNNGVDASLKVRSKAPANDARALLRFELPAAPAGCTLTDARLQLKSSGKPNRTMEALQVAGEWSESAVTWSNQPATTGAAVSTPSLEKGTIEWAVTAQAQAMYAGANNGFLIRDAAEGDIAGPEQVYHSREKGTDGSPKLVLTFTR